MVLALKAPRCLLSGQKFSGFIANALQYVQKTYSFKSHYFVDSAMLRIQVRDERFHFSRPILLSTPFSGERLWNGDAFEPDDFARWNAAHSQQNLFCYGKLCRCGKTELPSQLVYCSRWFLVTSPYVIFPFVKPSKGGLRNVWVADAHRNRQLRLRSGATYEHSVLAPLMCFANLDDLPLCPSIALLVEKASAAEELDCNFETNKVAFSNMGNMLSTQCGI